MKECGKINKILSRYIDGEAGSLDAILIKAHLDNCSSCRKELSGFSRVKELVSEKKRRALPPDYFIHLLRDRLANEQRIKDQRILWLASIGNLSRRLIPVPVAVIMLSLGFLIISYRQQANSCSLEDHILSGAQTTTDMVLRLMLEA